MIDQGIERHFTKMAAMGRSFQLGDLYDYRTDHILTECRLWWDSSKLVAATETNVEFKLNLIRPDSKFNSKWQHMGLDDHLQTSIVTGLIDKFRGASNYVNDQSSHSQATQTLVCRTKSRKERLDLPTLLQDNPLHLPESKEDRMELSLPKATHVVVGIVYGAEAYCVLTQDLGSHDADEDVREEAKENLGKFANKLENALGDIDFDMDLPDFKEQFNKDEKAQLSRLKCRLYVDLHQSSAVRECNVVDVYSHCLKMIRQIKNDVENKSKAIPIAVLLCPVNTILKLANGRIQKAFDFRDVDSELTARLCQNWVHLEAIQTRAEAIRTSTTAKKVSRASLQPFLKILNKYKDLLRESLKKGVTQAREGNDADVEEVERVTSIAENHGLFKPSRLERWLDFKVSESEIVFRICSLKEIVFVAGKKQLEKELVDSFDKKHALVLNIPSLDEKANEILEKMKDYCENYTKLVAVEESGEDEEDEGLPWHMVPLKTKKVMDKIRELANHLEKNNHLEKKVHFIITPAETSKDNCRFSLYEADNLLKDNISQLPSSPTGLKIRPAPAKSIKKTKPSIIVTWDYEDLGYPCQFCVEFRPKNSSEPWAQQKTTKSGENQVILNFNSGGPELEIRVAADTCIGRSEFSDVVDTESQLGVINISDSDEELECMARELSVCDVRREASCKQTAVSSQRTKTSVLKPPTGLQCDIVTPSTAELSWTIPVDARNPFLSYRVRYWRDGQTSSSAHELDVRETGCRLQQLLPATTYFVSVAAVSRDEQEVSPQSKAVELTTEVKEVRFAQTIVKRCEKIGNRNGMDVFAVPLIKSSGSRTTADRFAFGRADALNKGRKQHRTILVMGASGSGKTTLINGMINYIFNVEWEDTFRFQLIQEQTAGRSQVDSQTSRITAYDIHHAEGFRIPYSLTIVDTPGYGDTKGLERDQEITEMVRKFFEDMNGIQELDVVGFVAQASLPRLTPTQIYIFDSVLSIFGNDIKENINFLLTFADSQIPPVLSAITEADLPCPTDSSTGKPIHHKFNNSGFFCSSRESGNTVDKFNRFFWRMGMENFQRFFILLGTMKTKSLSLTKQVLDERKRLEATVDGLQPLIKIGLAKMEEMRKTKQMITNSQAQIDANENVEFVVDVPMPTKVEIPKGQHLTNCNKCHVTCHFPCMIPNDDGKISCWAMDHSQPEETRGCRICPENCIWNMHANQPYRWEYIKQAQATSSDAIKQKYEAELKRKLTAQELIQVLQKDLDENEKAVLERVETVSRCIQRLDEIALRPNPFSTPQYIDLIIDAEQQEKRLGFKERIESLKKLRAMADITNKIKNKESLLKPERKGDVENPAADEDDDDGLVTSCVISSRSANLSGWCDED